VVFLVLSFGHIANYIARHGHGRLLLVLYHVTTTAIASIVYLGHNWSSAIAITIATPYRLETAQQYRVRQLRHERLLYKRVAPLNRYHLGIRHGHLANIA
jgi:hypothetical protein